MFLISGGLLGLVAGLIAGGRVGGLARLRFRWPFVPPVALLVHEAGVDTPLAYTAVAPWLYMVSLAALVAWGAWHVPRIPGLVLIVAGMAMNLVVVAANSGHMPVSVALAGRGPQALLRDGILGQYVLAGRGTRLDQLGDWIALPGVVGRLFPQAYSPGDLVAFAGMAVTLFLATRAGRPGGLQLADKGAENPRV